MDGWMNVDGLCTDFVSLNLCECNLMFLCYVFLYTNRRCVRFSGQN
jgi:hypothetical protein